MSNTLTRFGNSALANNTTGANNSAFGHFAAYNNRDASCNTAIGANASFYNVHGKHNTAIGAGSMCNNVGGELNTAVGSSALEGPFPSGNVGDQNVAIGAQALYSNYGIQNVGVGCYALQNNTSGTANTAVGYQALYSNTTGYNNVGVGYQSLYSNTTGQFNTGIGYYALTSNTTGFTNTAIGMGALTSNTTGNYNMAIGYYALQANTSGPQNTAVGLQALGSNTTGQQNTAIGFEAGQDLSGNSNYNTFLGYNTDVSSNTLTYNNSTALGYNATIDASNQIVLGGQNASGAYPSVYIPGSYVGIHTYNPGNGFTLDVSGNLNTTMDASINSITVGRGGGNIGSNTAVGFEALQVSTINSSDNTAIGNEALNGNTDGQLNTAIGSGALQLNTTGSYNTAIGVSAGTALSGNSSFNTFLGCYARASAPLVEYNNSTAIGYYASIDASNQIVLGGQDLVNGTPYPSVYIPGSYVGIGGVYNPGNGFTLDVLGNLNTTMDASINSITVGRGGGNVASNTAVGYQALYSDTSGNNNTAVGYRALYSDTSGNSNTAVGYQALYYNTAGGTNVATGQSALHFNTTGGSNIATGYEALLSNTTGNNNIAIGRQALLYNQTGFNTVAIGNNAGLNAGYNDLSGNSYGNTFVGTNTDVSSNLLPYTNSTALGNGAIIDASNSIILGNSAIQFLKCQVALTVVSDARDKTNFEPLDAGVNFINEINPVRFDWNQRAGGLEGRKDVGFTAQNLIEAQEKTKISIPHLVDVSNPEKYTIMNTQLLPILVKAVQELSAKVIILETELSELKK